MAWLVFTSRYGRFNYPETGHPTTSGKTRRHRWRRGGGRKGHTTPGSEALARGLLGAEGRRGRGPHLCSAPPPRAGELRGEATWLSQQHRHSWEVGLSHLPPFPCGLEPRLPLASHVTQAAQLLETQVPL